MPTSCCNQLQVTTAPLPASESEVPGESVTPQAASSGLGWKFGGIRTSVSAQPSSPSPKPAIGAQSAAPWQDMPGGEAQRAPQQAAPVPKFLFGVQPAVPAGQTPTVTALSVEKVGALN
jgi:hypothetical protein